MIDMKLELCIDSKPLDIELDDVVAGLLAVRLDLPANADHRDAITRYLNEKGRAGASTRTTCADGFCAG